MTRRAAILAVDAGGSKSDVALLRRDGTVLGAARVLGGEIDSRTWLMQQHVEERHLVPVGVAIAEAARRAGLDPERLPVADLGVFCLAGADLPADDRRLLRWVRSNGWTETEVLRNDTFAVLRAGTDRPWGVGVVCGYGTNCSAVSPDGRITRFPAIGPISGDWGGGGELERAVVPGSGERVVDGRVEAAVRALASGKGETGQLEQLGADAQRARPVQPGELGVGAEAGEECLQAPELLLRLGERAVVLFRVEQELDLRPHRIEAVAQHQDVRVVVSGGSVTTRTAGTAARVRRRAVISATSAASSRSRCS